MKHKVDFKTVIPAAQAGDKAARDALMEGFYGWTVLYAKRIVKDFDLAADIAVSYWTWLYTKGGIQKYDGGIPAFVWIRRQLWQHISQYRRDMHPAPVETRAVVEDVAGGDTPEELASAAELVARLEAGLDPEELMILNGMFRGLDVREIARLIDRPAATTLAMRTSLRRKIRDLLT